MANPLKERLKAGRAAIGCWVSIPDPAVMEILAELGPDWLMIDTEHGPADDATVENLLRAAKGTAVVPLVRVAANDAALIKKALDRGARGVLVPLVSSPEEAERAVQACRYPPLGIRGVAGSRANRYGLDLSEYFERWNEDVLVGCQVETAPALERVEAIAGVPGVDLLFVGPNDLSAALGCFRQFSHPDYQKALQRVVQAARAAGVAAGYMASGPEEARLRIEQGFQFVSLSSDARLLQAAARRAFEAVRSAVGG